MKTPQDAQNGRGGYAISGSRYNGCLNVITFVDPRVEGGKLNQRAEADGDVVEVIDLKGKELLFYKSIPINVLIIRASYADTNGNCTFQREATIADAISMAQAAKNSGGKVIVQMEKLVEYPSLDPRLIKLPGIYVDAIVVADPINHRQTFCTMYNPAYCGEIRVPVSTLEPLPLDERKIVAHRVAMELMPRAVMNLGIGMPEGVAAVAGLSISRRIRRKLSFAVHLWHGDLKLTYRTGNW